MGGEITYDYIGGNAYLFHVTLYRDCFGIPAATNVTVNYSSAVCFPGAGQQVLYPTGFSPQQIAPVCPGAITTCNGGSFTGIEKWVYEGVITLPANCPDWTFTYSECCRNAAITNLNIPDTYGATFSATLDNLTYPANSSVRFSSDPVPFLYTGSLNQVNNGAFDFDGDSIVVSLVNPITDAGTPAPYNAPRTYLDPVSAVSPMSFDQSTGDFYVTPTNAEVDVIGYNVQEYRGGVLIGSVTRDIQVTILNGSNTLPSLSPINGSGGYILSVCAGDTINFGVTSADADAGQSTVISYTSTLPGLAITHTGGPLDAINAYLVTDGTMSSVLPYVLLLTVRDDACPFNGLQTYSYQIYINGCSADVWPGDANNDLNCNMYDYLNIGLGYGSMGPARAGASLAWVAQPATDWGTSFAGGTDYKFADCNGDGTIDDADTNAIVLNYGLTHPIRHAAPNIMLDAAAMHFAVSNSTPNTGDQVIISVQLGDQTQIASNVYGLGFRINFDPALVDGAASTFAFLYGQLGNPASDLLIFSRPNWTDGYIDALAVRKDHQAMNVSGTLAQINMRISPNAGNQPYTLSFTNILGVDATGNLKTYTTSPAIVRVSNTTGISDPSTIAVELYPNPAGAEIRFSGKDELQKVNVKDAQGRIVFQTAAGWNDRTIRVSNLPEGIYVAEITSHGTLLRKTFCIQR